MLENNLEMKKDSTPTRQNGEEINRVNDSSLGAEKSFTNPLIWDEN